MTNEVTETKQENKEVVKQQDISSAFIDKLKESWAMVLPKHMDWKIVCPMSWLHLATANMAWHSIWKKKKS